MKLKVLVIISCFLFLNGCTSLSEIERTTSTESVHSHSNKGCFVCDMKGIVMAGTDKEFDSIGVVNLHTGDLWDIELYTYDKNGRAIDDSGSFNTRYNPGNDRGSTVKLSTIGGRGVCQVDITLDENSILDLDKASGELCSECLAKISALDDDFENMIRPEDRLDVVLYDFIDNEFYSLNKMNKMYFIRDYLVHIDCGDDKEEVLIVYTPDRVG